VDVQKVQPKGKGVAFSDMPKSATASAQIYSLVETVKLNGQEPYAWLRQVLERLPYATSVDDYEAMLPWNCSPGCHGKPLTHLGVGGVYGANTVHWSLIA